MNAGGSEMTTRIGSTVERLLVRTWNLFHGNTQPPGRKAFLEQMVRLASADRPAVLCLQEVPVWALGQLDDWGGMPAVVAVAQRPHLGPFPSTAEVGRVLTELPFDRRGLAVDPRYARLLRAAVLEDLL